MSYSIFNDSSKRTSGQRFWTQLTDELKRGDGFDENHARAVFFNISAPLLAILKVKLARKKVILRLDGIYHEKVSPAAIEAMDSRLGEILIRFIYQVFGPVEWGALVMNLITHNAKLLFKVWFADALVFQSEFSRKLWQRYYPRKPSIVALNGAKFFGRKQAPEVGDTIRVVTTYDSWRPSKRLHDLIGFVREHNAESVRRGKKRVRLLILGYRHDQTPANLTPEDVAWIENSGEAEVLPPFTEYTEAIATKLREQHAYLTFSFNDNCPNAVIEAMAFGLPVVALNSGGIPQIVGDAGVVVAVREAPSYFCSFDHSFEYPEFDSHDVSAGLEKLLGDYDGYCARVKRRFDEELETKKVASRYLRVLETEL